MSVSVEPSRRNDQAGHLSKSEFARRVSTAAQLRQIREVNPQHPVIQLGVRRHEWADRTVLFAKHVRDDRNVKHVPGVVTRGHAVDQDTSRRNVFMVDSGTPGRTRVERCDATGAGAPWTLNTLRRRVPNERVECLPLRRDVGTATNDRPAGLHTTLSPLLEYPGASLRDRTGHDKR
jgi:hypothetical protein